MLDIHKVTQLISQEISNDEKFLKTLASFYMDMKLCSSDSEKLLSAKILLKEMDRIRNDYFSYNKKVHEPGFSITHNFNIRRGGKNGA